MPPAPAQAAPQDRQGGDEEHREDNAERQNERADGQRWAVRQRGFGQCADPHHHDDEEQPDGKHPQGGR